MTRPPTIDCLIVGTGRALSLRCVVPRPNAKEPSSATRLTQTYASVWLKLLTASSEAVSVPSIPARGTRHAPTIRQSIPTTAKVQGCLLFALFDRIVTGLADALDVALIPEERFPASMRYLVVSYEPRGVRLDPLAHLTGEQITDQDGHSELLPTGRLIPPPPRLAFIPMTRTFGLIAWCIEGLLEPWR